MPCAQCGEPFRATGKGRPRRYCGRACQARAYRARRDGDDRARRAATPSRSSRSTVFDRTTLVLTAIDIADAHGMAALSMRALAARMDVPATSLYRQVSSKNELIAAMIDTAFGDLPLSQPGAAEWRALLEREAHREWELYLRHPWLLEVLNTTRPPLAPAVLAATDRVFAALSGLGLDREAQLSVYLLVSGYVQGMASMVAASRRSARQTGISERDWWSTQRGKLTGLLGSGRYPWLSELAAARPSATRADLDRWFEFGLHRLLDGVAVFVFAP
ncbi:TetR/AcrR family transcriptional regulator [Saccharomonospora piscinae]|uniref:TetR/AcrR family transcriptional regulator n=1 Tax=Saccharomonospora piscinae TaxID=687388 RepID=UPI000463C40D|nr:TetR/AcrR family transcriptional regulator [Saccharomonospora piscinae]